MQFTTTVLQRLSLAGMLTIGTLTTLPTLSQSAETPIPMPTPMGTPGTIPPIPVMPSVEPSATPVKTEEPAEPKKQIAKETIVDVAVANGSFKTLTAALKAADLVETLQGDGPFTVFAPTDAAFAKLPKGTVETLLKPENKAELVRILTYHVVPGNVLSSSLKSGKVKTIEGSNIKVMVDQKGVMINQSTVTTADVKASNGVIHVIDTVLLPPAKPVVKQGPKKPEMTPDKKSTKVYPGKTTPGVVR
jgi:uncharacterized surface protein with fasciclin (FAS1) repeats